MSNGNSVAGEGSVSDTFGDLQRDHLQEARRQFSSNVNSLTHCGSFWADVNTAQSDEDFSHDN